MIHPDIRQAHTPPSEWYRSEQAYHETIERVFPFSWQYVADVVAQHTHTLEPATILPHTLGEQVLVIRNQGSVPRSPLSVLSNVCTHRGTTLINEPCSLREIKCPYHGRRFSLDGRCIHMPEFTEVEGFPSASDNLSPLPHFALGPLLFARIHAHPGGAELMVQDSLVTLPDDVLSMFAPLHLERCILRPSATRTFEINAHWALYVENYLEGFHVPFVHGGLNAVLDYGAYETRLYEGGVLQVGIGKPGEQRFDELPGNIVALYYWMFPNTMINVYPWGISLNVVEPAGLHRTLVHYRVYVMDEGKVGQGAGADLDRVELEDDAIVESVHRGMRSRIYHRGRYSPTRETGVHHFHRLLFP